MTAAAIGIVGMFRASTKPSGTPASARAFETFKAAINALTVKDRGTSEIRDRIEMSKPRPFPVKSQAYLVPKKSIFNKVVGEPVSSGE